LPWEFALILYIAVTVVSAALYWLLWRTMQRPAATGIEGMMGGIGTVFRLSEGRMKVFYRGETWDARCSEATSLGERVEITGLDYMKLVVRRRV
jgi:membrane protein implicated in regulation of membrane protease activity